MTAISLNIISGNVVKMTSTSNPPFTPDVTPNPTPLWGNISFDIGGELYTVNKSQVSGINTSVTLKLQSSTVIRSGDVVYLYISKTEPRWADGGVIEGRLEEQGFGQLNDQQLFIVNPGDWVSFGIGSTLETSKSYTMTIVNTSDANAILDTFTANVVTPP